MKKLIIALLVLSAFYSCSNNQPKKESVIKIKGKISKVEDNTVVIKYQHNSDTIKVDNAGNFETTLKIDKPCYAVIINGDNQTLTFLSPNSETHFEADATDFLNTLIFKKDNAEINNYLVSQKKIVQTETMTLSGFVYADSYEEFSSAYEVFIAKYENNMNNITKNAGSKFESFKKAEAEGFKLLKIMLLIDFQFTAKFDFIELPEDYSLKIEKISSEIDINNPDIIFFSDYIPYVTNLISDNTSEQIEKDSIEDYNLAEYVMRYFKEIDKLFTNNDNREDIYFYFLKDFIRSYGPRSVAEPFKTYKSFSVCKERVSIISSLIAEYDIIATGKPSVEWSFPDNNGKNISSTEFLGKYLYIDVWASWCGPCKRQIPYLEALKKKLSGKNIAFISISVDDNLDEWKSSLKSESATGIQLYTGGWENILSEHFKINSIPRFILIDREGNIIDYDAEEPSGDIESIINALEGI